MKKKILFGLIALCLISGVFAYTFTLGSYEVDIHQELADSIDAEVIAKNESLEKIVADKFVEEKQQELISSKRNEIDNLYWEIAGSKDIDKLNELITALTNINDCGKLTCPDVIEK